MIYNRGPETAPDFFEIIFILGIDIYIFVMYYKDS